MATEIRVPSLGESITEATVSKWLKRPGEPIALDEPVAELETDKVTLEVPAPAAGTLAQILANEGANVPVGAVLGVISDGAAATPQTPAAPGLPSAATAEFEGPAVQAHSSPPRAGPFPSPLTPTPPSPASGGGLERGRGEGRGEEQRALERSGPAARKLIEEGGIDSAAIAPTGPGGRITKADVLTFRGREEAPPAAPPPVPAASEREVRVRMSRLRRRIAERLKAAQNTAAMLTTFNEIDMSQVMALRERHRDAFEKKHSVRLGFMSIFVKAATVALKELPAVNAEIDGEEIVYKNHYDIGVAVGTEQGLVVPVLREADRLSFAEIEKAIAEYGRKAREGKLTIQDLSGGTFTISNGGIYGSLMSTPILNPPQSGILGMHKIERRPVAVGDEVEIRPMMYVALSYDHRIVDGREAVTFLVRIKECVEDPSRILFEM